MDSLNSAYVAPPSAVGTAQFTPGPWGLSSESPRIIKQFDFMGETSVILGSASGYPNSGYFPTDEVATANARLMAAAPDLLEALRELQSAVAASFPSAEAGQAAQDAWAARKVAAHERARAAIAKATGGAA